MSGTKTLDDHNNAVMASCVRLTGISGTGGHTSADLATFLEAYSAERAARLKAEAELDAFIHEGSPDAVQHLTTRALRAEERAARAEAELAAVRAQLATLRESVSVAIVTEDGDPADWTRCEPLRRALARLT